MDVGLESSTPSFLLRPEIAISSWYGQAISSSFAASRFRALIVVERRRAALFVLTVGVSRLPTPLLRQWLLPHPVTWRGFDCLVALAAIDAPPALFYS